MHAQTDDAQLKNIMPPAPSLGWTGIKIPADTRQPGLYYFRFWQLSGQHNHLRAAVKSRFKNLQNHERLLKKKLKKITIKSWRSISIVIQCLRSHYLAVP